MSINMGHDRGGRLRRVLQNPRWQGVIYAEVGAIILLALAALPGGFDYWGYYHKLATGCVSCTYNPYFTEWFLRPLGVFADWRAGYLVWCAISIAALYPAAKALGGSPLTALVSAPFLWILWLGQMDIIPAAGLALAWWGVQPGGSTARRVLAGLGLLMMATKPQMMGFAIILLVLWGGWRTLIIPAAGAALSFALYGGDWVARWLAYTPQTVFGGDAWFYISAPVLLVGLAGALVIAPRLPRLHYIIAGTLIGAPFLGAYSFFVLALFRLRPHEIAAGYLPFIAIGLTGDLRWLGLLIVQPILVMARLLRAHGSLVSWRLLRHHNNRQTETG